MRAFVIQLQPGLSPGCDSKLVRDLLDRLESNSGLIESLVVTEGDDNGSYINFTVTTRDMASLWELMKQELFSHPVAGPHLKCAAIVICEGNAGWDDYLLLHHFDGAEPLDSVDGNR
jgi:hypothetical protein